MRVHVFYGDSECLRLWQDDLPFLTSEDKDWILHRAVAEVLNWPE